MLSTHRVLPWKIVLALSTELFGRFQGRESTNELFTMAIKGSMPWSFSPWHCQMASLLTCLAPLVSADIIITKLFVYWMDVRVERYIFNLVKFIYFQRAENTAFECWPVLGYYNNYSSTSFVSCWPTYAYLWCPSLSTEGTAGSTFQECGANPTNAGIQQIHQCCESICRVALRWHHKLFQTFRLKKNWKLVSAVLGKCI